MDDDISDGPSRLVPIVCDPQDFMVLVSGDPLRTDAYAFAQNGYLDPKPITFAHLDGVDFGS